MNTDRIVLNGSLKEVHQSITYLGVQLNTEETRQFLDCLIENQRYLDSNDTAIKTLGGIEGSPPNTFGFLVLDNMYHINIKAASLNLLLCLINNSIVKSIVKNILNVVLGVSDNIVTKIDQFNGELCLIREIASNNRRCTVEVLSKNKGKCWNNDISCSFREGDNCRCEQKNVKEILNSFVGKKVLRQKDGVYILNL